MGVMALLNSSHFAISWYIDYLKNENGDLYKQAYAYLYLYVAIHSITCFTNRIFVDS